MCPDKSNEHDPELVLNRNDQTITVSSDVEDYPVIGYETGIPIDTLDVRRRLPGCFLYVSIPGLQSLTSITMTFPKFPKPFPRDDAHERIIQCSRHGSKGKLGEEGDCPDVGQSKRLPPDHRSPESDARVVHRIFDHHVLRSAACPSVNEAQHNNEFGTLRERIRSIPNSLLCLVAVRFASRAANLRCPVLLRS